VSFARKDDEFQNRGAEITAICVDSPEQNRAMIEKLLLPFRILSDPEGELAIKR
jgi:peroxiredoxin